MKAIKDKLKKANPLYISAAGFVIPVVIAALFSVFVLKPFTEKNNLLQEQVLKNESEIAKSIVMERKLSELKVANSKLQNDLQEASKKLPQREAVDVIPDILAGFARENGLVIVSVNPGPRASGPNGVYEEQPFNVVLNGSFHDVSKMVEKVDSLTQLSTMTELKMDSAKMQGTKMLIPVKFTLLTFTASGGK